MQSENNYQNTVSTAVDVKNAKVLSPKRNTTKAETTEGLVEEQLSHFGIDASSEYGKALANTAHHLYGAHASVMQLWDITSNTLQGLDKEDRVAYFNAKKFLSFQIAKTLDTLQNPFRATYQSLSSGSGSQGHYPLFDNVTALFSATPVVVRTATYVYACTEWVDDAFQGKEFTHQIYSRLLNPTNISCTGLSHLIFGRLRNILPCQSGKFIQPSSFTLYPYILQCSSVIPSTVFILGIQNISTVGLAFINAFKFIIKVSAGASSASN